MSAAVTSMHRAAQVHCGLDSAVIDRQVVGGRVQLRLASSHPGEPLWYRLAAREGRL